MAALSGAVADLAAPEGSLLLNETMTMHHRLTITYRVYLSP